MLVHTCDSAAEFLRTLDLAGGDWPRRLADGREVTWLFRGHADSSWALQAPAYRAEVISGALAPWLAESRLAPNIEGLIPKSIADYYLTRHRVACHLIVRDFLKLADEIGFKVPTYEAWEVPLYQISRQSPFWPAEASSLTAFAQHHRIPTRLLDFSFNPRVAAFFAADAAPAEFERDMCVWAVPMETLDIDVVRPVSCPRADNLYLHAQDGILLSIRNSESHFKEKGEVWPTLTDLVDDSQFRKIILPGRGRADLLARLERVRMTRAHMMPTLENVGALIARRHRRSGR